ncbi:MAG: hypothetical protein ACP5OZ_02440 [Candidatus Woesearchaeota archaeon]
MKKTDFRTFIFTALFFALISALTTNAITASIANPRMVLRVNVTKENPGFLENSIRITNNNDYETLVEVQPDDVLNSLNAELSETRFKLMPNESRDVSFKLTVTSVGLHDGKLLVSFRGKPLNSTSEEQVGLAAGIVVIAYGENYTGTIGAKGAKPKPTSSPTKTETPAENQNEKPNQANTDNLSGQVSGQTSGQTGASPNTTAEIVSRGTNPLVGILIIIIIVGIGVFLFLKVRSK